MGQNSIITSFFLHENSLVRSPLQELEVGPRSVPYLLVFNIWQEDFRPDFIRPPPSRSYYPPWMLKWDGLKNWKKKIFSNFSDLKKKWIFGHFFRFFFSGFGWTGELWSNRVVLILRKKEDFFLPNYFSSIIFKILI